MPRLPRLIRPVVLLLGALLAACASNSPGEALLPDFVPGSGAAETGPVTVALLAPQTAPDQYAAELGQAIVNAARLAERDANDPRLDLRVYDTGGVPARAAQVASRALDEGAQLILGPLFAESTSAIATAARAAGVNVVSFSTDSSVAGGPVLLSGFLPGMAAARIAGYARTHGYGPIGIIYPETPYGSVALAGAREGAGASLVAQVSYPRTVEAIPAAAGAFAADVQASGARGLVLADSGQGLQYVAALLAQHGLDDPDHRFLGLGEWDTRSTLDSPELVGGWFASADPRALRSFVARYDGSYGAVPPRLAVLGYDAVQIAAQLLEEAERTGSGDPFDRGALTRAQGFRGAVGPIRFLADGRSMRGLAVLEIGDNAFRVIDPAPSDFGAAF